VAREVQRRALRASIGVPQVAAAAAEVYAAAGLGSHPPRSLPELEAVDLALDVKVILRFLTPPCIFH
jgi:hypothetical protein